MPNFKHLMEMQHYILSKRGWEVSEQVVLSGLLWNKVVCKNRHSALLLLLLFYSQLLQEAEHTSPGCCFGRRLTRLCGSQSNMRGMRGLICRHKLSMRVRACFMCEWTWQTSGFLPHTRTRHLCFHCNTRDVPDQTHNSERSVWSAGGLMCVSLRLSCEA